MYYKNVKYSFDHIDPDQPSITVQGCVSDLETMLNRAAQGIFDINALKVASKADGTFEDCIKKGVSPTDNIFGSPLEETQNYYDNKLSFLKDSEAGGSAFRAAAAGVPSGTQEAE